MNVSEINAVIPEDIYNALVQEATKRGMSVEVLATAILCGEVCVTLGRKSSAA